MVNEHPGTSAVNLFDMRDSFGDLSAEGAELTIGRWINGRIIAVLGTPIEGTSSDMAYGVSVVPAGRSTPSHSHRAEELAFVLRGRGEITIGQTTHSVVAGDILRTPPHSIHQTKAGDGDAMYVLWVYAPAGSEDRWLAEQTEEN